MKRAEHRREAERLLEQDSLSVARPDDIHRVNTLARAQIHATLALGASTLPEALAEHFTPAERRALTAYFLRLHGALDADPLQPLIGRLRAALGETW